MRKLIYSMQVSLDGYIADPRGEIDWSVPDPELFQFHIEQTRELCAHLCGRRLYEVMTYWETAEENLELPEPEREFARLWNALPKIVFSRTLERVDGSYTLASGSPVEEVARLKEEPGGDIAVGGAGLAAACIEAGLVDELRPFVLPVVLGGGTPFLPPLEERIELELLETRRVGSSVVYQRHRCGRPGEPARER
jgi:dihydrofolate reductase